MKILITIVVAATLAAACSDPLTPRPPKPNVLPEQRAYEPPPPTTPRPPIYAEPETPKAGGPKPGQTNNFMSPERPSNDRDRAKR
ncbi:MAG: hypothetical protein ACREV9_01335 [Burkholderiales bacterium]